MSREIDNKNNRARIDQMEAEVAQNTNRIAHLNEVREQKEIDIA
jgi:hypothetical protein